MPMKDETLKEKILRWFSEWAKLKPHIHFSSNQNVFPKRREIWWVSLGQNIGVEMNGKNDAFERPVLVVKVFNVQALLVAPVSSMVHEDQYLFPFKNILGVLNVVNLSQLRTISSKRFRRKIGEMGTQEFGQIVRLVKDFL